MASKAFSLFSLALLILLSLLSAHAHHSDLAESNDEKQSPFVFIRNLQGCRKGERVKGIQELKKYLDRFGYLNYNSGPMNERNANDHDDDFDDQLESALKTYQLNYNLKPTGVLDAATVSTMTMPRCGVPDIVNGTTRMRSGKQSRHHHHGNGSTHFHTVSQYSFFPGRPRWPRSKYSLTYAFLPGTRSDAIGAVQRAFQTWAACSKFTFTRTSGNADIRISFERRNHGDGLPFDGRGGVLAHAFAPTDGRFHYDADDLFSDGPTPGTTDLETVALHEIGHLLGLGHSSVQGAVMFPTIPSGVRGRVLQPDDKEGIRVLYS